MKNTIVMVGCILTFFITWMFLGLFGMVLSGIPYREVMTSVPMYILIFFFGWIPSVFVGSDLDEYMINQRKLGVDSNNVVSINPKENTFRSAR